MSQIEQKVDKLSEMLVGFIQSQQTFNTRIEKKIEDFDTKVENLSQKVSDIDTKIDRIEYRLESQIAAQMDLLFEEMKEVSEVVQKQEDEVIQVRYDFSKLRKDVRELQTA